MASSTVSSSGCWATARPDAPFVLPASRVACERLGDDFWSYGVARNRHVVEAFLRHHHAQGLSSRLVGVDEMFHPTTFEVSQL